MKAVISNRIYMPADKQLMDELAKQLTYRIYTKQSAIKGGPDIIRTFQRINANMVSLPAGRLDLIPKHYEIVDKRITKPIEDFPKFRFTLRDSQQAIYDAIDDFAILNAPVSYGKTFCGIAFAAKLKQKTLVVTHTTMLRDQWIQEIEKCLGITPGIVGSGKFDIDAPIVVSNIQTLVKRVDSIAEEFGTVILDECLDYETTVDTLELGKVKLGSLVNGKKSVHVRSFDLENNEEVYRRVVNWYKKPFTDCLKIKHAAGSLKATANHSFFIETDKGVEKVRAENLKLGDRLILTNNTHKANCEITEEFLPVFLGMLLGDGSLDLTNKSTNSVRLKITHGEAQLDYLLYKEQILTKFVSQNIIEGTSGYANTKIYSFNTRSFIDRFNLKEQIYAGKSSKNRITPFIADSLTTLSWGFIFQDDGSNTQDNVVFSFCEFDIPSVILLGNSLIKLGLCEDYHIFTCSRGFNYLRLDAENSRIFQKKIAKYIHPALRYKLTRKDLDKFEPLDIDVGKFIKPYYTREITGIEPAKLTGNHRFNIEVEGTHTYFANNILVSNCHHTPATTFSSVIDKCKARYKIGLTGTLERKDGKHILFKDYFGPVLFKPKAENYMVPEVVIVKTDIMLSGIATWANKVTELEVYNDKYRNLVIELADSAANQGHKVLVVGGRVEFLERAATLTKNKAVSITGNITSLIERQDILASISDDAKILFGTCSIFAEGISQNDLSCIILATPINNNPLLTQLIGRIVRLKEGKLTPLVIDINLAGTTGRSQANARLGHYIGKGYKVSTIDKSS
jgi:superfamily II DNA or RNA helicase